VVRDLTQGLDRKGHIVVCNNFFIAPSLFEHLYNRGIYATGTLKEIRIGLPTALLGYSKGEFTQGTLFWRMHDRHYIAMTVWFDSKVVYLLSTLADPVGPWAHALHWRNGIREPIPSTLMQVEYQSHMRGVDVVDQMRRDYSVQFHSHKWWHKVFFFVHDSSLQNSWVHFKNDREGRNIKTSSRLKFYYAIDEHLIEDWLDSPDTYKVDCLQCCDAIHYSYTYRKRRRQCIVCKRKVRFMCPTCGGTYLCLGPYFVKVHSQKKWALRVLRWG
jgi:hypothetical protein